MTDTTDSPVRIALVTGAAQGIGEAIALRLADDGLDVAVADLPQQREQLEAVAEAIRAKGRRSICLYADVSLEPDVVAMVAQTAEQLGGLDVMVANAGIAPIAAIIDTTVEQWESVLAVNGRGTFLAIKHAARQMIAQGRGGRIIAASSIAGKRGINLASAYSASKFAVRGLVQAAAVELRQHNITVNAYAPGSIMTPLSWHPDDDINGGHGTTFLKMLNFPPEIKPAPPAVVASLVSCIAKTESFYITGQCINVDGGAVMD
ncbi:NAD-P-binding protein [Trametes maxima]|nr:NAD-P-binding protein [Trametes maxima]